MVSHGGSGSTSLIGLALLAGIVLLRRRKPAKAVAITAASLLSLSTQAESSCEFSEALTTGDCWHLDAGIGYSQLKPDLNNTGWRFSDDMDTGSKVMTGIRFSPHL